MSTSALLDLFEVKGEPRKQIELMRRPESVQIRHPIHGTATVRDQKPMSDGALKKCLVGLTPIEWYRILNHRVFFWPTEARLKGLLNARPYRASSHCVLVLDTRTVIEQYARKITLSPINSGSTIYKAQSRGKETFRAIATYPFEERRRLRGFQNAVAEFAVDYAMPDISKHVISVEQRRGDRILDVIWRR